MISSIIWTGDYNCILDGALHRYPCRLNTKHRMSLALQTAVTNLGLRDSWRDTHPGTQEYTCHSLTHDTHSRSDCIYVSDILL